MQKMFELVKGFFGVINKTFLLLICKDGGRKKEKGEGQRGRERKQRK